jgi:hypothetical protein
MATGSMSQIEGQIQGGSASTGRTAERLHRTDPAGAGGRIGSSE